MTFDDSRPDDAKLERLWVSEPSDAVRDAQADLERQRVNGDELLVGAIVIAVLLVTLAVVITLQGGLS
jgi:hypothetical protein